MNAPRIVSRGEWGSARAPAVNAKVPLPIHTVVIHHSAGPSLDEYGAMRGVERTHAGMRDIAYIAGAGQSGNLYEARDGVLDTSVDVGGHTAGWNSKAYAICALGNFENEYPTDQLIESMNWLIAVKQFQGVLVGPEALQIIPHRDAAPDGTVRPNGGATLCCGRHLIARLGELGRWTPPAEASLMTFGPEIKEDDVREVFTHIAAGPDGKGWTAIPGRSAGAPSFQGPNPPTDGYWPHLDYRPTLSKQQRGADENGPERVIVTLTGAPPHSTVGIFQPIA